MNRVTVVLLSAAISLAACSKEPEPSEAAGTSEASSLPRLPTSSSERVLLEGKMNFWMYEGDAGCYGSLERDGEEVQLWIDAESCGEKEYAEGEDAAVVVTFRSDEQYGPGKTYTIVEFQ